MYYLGVDFGQAQDYTALAILEPARIPTGLYERSGRPKVRAELHCRHLERFPLRTPYPEIVRRVGQRVQALPQVERITRLEGMPRIVNSDHLIIADATGVGRPVIELLRQANLQTVAVTITGGQKVNFDRGYNVPKRDLVMAVQVLLQEGRLKFAEGLPEVGALVKELLAMQVKITDDAHDTYGAWREGTHDDLALAVGMAAWYMRLHGEDR